MYCLDTNVIIDIFRGNEEIKSKLESLKIDQKGIFVTPISLFELYKGAYLSSKVNEALRLITEFIKTVEILNIDEFACEEFGKEYARLKGVGKIPNETDLMIAAIVKANDLVLITKDKKDFENIDIETESW